MSVAYQRLSGLYVILDPSIRRDRPLAEVMTAAAAGGVKIFQYRNKCETMKEAYAEAVLLRKVADRLGAVFVVNDRCDLALAVEADGVHLGQGDLPYADARRLMGTTRLIGLSTHNAEQVKEAERLKPDYIGFGPIFRPASKQDHDSVVGLDGLRAIRPLTSLPIFGIGGITLDQAGAVIQAGADGVAGISAVVNAPDVEKAVAELISQLGLPSRPGS
jgi:thiamine-phosphate pyrophosphorylase